jgi:hypothetical protein
MRFVEILDGLSNTFLFEMAHERKIAKQIVTDLSPQIFDHLLKIFVFENPQGVNHWINELDNWFGKINKIYLKPKKSKPHKDDLYNWMIFDAAPHYAEPYVTNTIRIMKRREYKNLPLRDFDVEEILVRIFNIIGNVCKDISDNNFETIQDYL